MARNNPFQRLYNICNSTNPLLKINNISSFPTYFDIELTNYCNFKCLMCPTGIGTMQRTQGFMSDKVYYKILEELKDKDVGIRFVRWGEPTLHRNFIKYVKKAKEYSLLCHLNTNGYLLTPDILQSLVDLKLDSVKFSFQGVDVESYSEMRGSGHFEKVVEVIEQFFAIRGNNELPYIHISTTTTYESEEKIEKFKTYMSQYSDLVTVGITLIDHIDVTNYNNKKFDIPMYKKRFECCPEVFDKLSIDWNGDVTACCNDYNSEMVVGNILNNSLQEIWDNDKISVYREAISKRDYDKFPLCRVCYDYMHIQTLGED